VSFAARQARAASPLIPLRMLRSRTVAVANLMRGLMVSGIFGMFFLGALYEQRVLGYDAIQVGVAFLPVALGIAAMSLRLAARSMARFGSSATALGGLALIAVGLVLLRRAPVDAGYAADLLPAMALAGLGAGLAFPALTTLGMSAASPEDSGLASGLLNATQQVGGALGLAVLATLATTRAASARAHGAASQVALTDGYHLAFTVSAVLVFVAVAIGVVGLRPARAADSVEQGAAPRGVVHVLDRLGIE